MTTIKTDIEFILSTRSGNLVIVMSELLVTAQQIKENSGLVTERWE
ncbi:hypothetical protein JCM19232_4002 [Vibrio ishigakensis]|uniref:Uncharacterized protein n=1 Tax=Vibrio ishigakensis TaxID=1481914 RepID=A0A0B8P2R2_9VIBR|nr:hypothetical protein JCM19232_4002 [Vibrio ishigakensis]